MESSKPVILKSTSALSLHERFSQVLLDQETGPSVMDPVLPQLKRAPEPPPVFLVVKEPSSLVCLQGVGVARGMRWHLRRRRRRSVWTRLGWQQVTRRSSTYRRRGFWSFTNKYRWRSRFSSTHFWGRGHLQRHLQTRTKVQRLTTGPHLSLNLPRGVASKRRRSQDDVPTKKQLDKQLDEYMSLSKKHLDKQLDNYMSLSKSRLDAELDEYMSMAGDTLSQWD
ncbi:hypothetical protein INR49_006449 [Caranx melampygus]|nr:hypothetical protein INR49_006449 [Caranx melampygus]